MSTLTARGTVTDHFAGGDSTSKMVSGWRKCFSDLAIHDTSQYLTFFDESSGDYPRVTPGGTLGADNNTNLCIKKHFHTLHMKNNYVNGVYVRAYLITPKMATSRDPLFVWGQGLDDCYTNVSTAGLAGNVNVFLTDSPEFNSIFRIIDSHKEFVKPGEHFRFKSPAIANGEYIFDKGRWANTQAAGGTTHVPGELMWVYSMHGELAHDSVDNTLVNYGDFAMDIAYDDRMTYYYNGGGPGRKSFAIIDPTALSNGHQATTVDSVTVQPTAHSGPLTL